VEDRRGAGPKMAMGGGIGIVGIILLLVLTGGDIGKVLNVVLQQQGQQQPAGGGGGQFDPEDPQQQQWADVVSRVLATTEDVWTEQLPRLPGELARPYEVPRLVMFTGSVQSGCGFAAAQMGPFYCPADQKVYIDLGFFDDMEKKLQAPGDFAQAYVVAHEVGHHVQNLLGLSDHVHRIQQQSSQEEGNQASVRLELQADFLAGVWAHHAQQNWNILEEGDIDEGINAALAIGDDRLQKQSQGYVVPENFTHGTSQQRRKWFVEGLNSGDASRLMELFERPYDQL
jgi:uncharacterized protein